MEHGIGGCNCDPDIPVHRVDDILELGMNITGVARIAQSSHDLCPGRALGAQEQHVEGGQDGDRGEERVP